MEGSQYGENLTRLTSLTRSAISWYRGNNRKLITKGSAC